MERVFATFDHAGKCFDVKEALPDWKCAIVLIVKEGGAGYARLQWNESGKAVVIV